MAENTFTYVFYLVLIVALGVFSMSVINSSASIDLDLEPYAERVNDKGLEHILIEIDMESALIESKIVAQSDLIVNELLPDTVPNSALESLIRSNRELTYDRSKYIEAARYNKKQNMATAARRVFTFVIIIVCVVSLFFVHFGVGRNPDRQNSLEES